MITKILGPQGPHDLQEHQDSWVGVIVMWCWLGLEFPESIICGTGIAGASLVGWEWVLSLSGHGFPGMGGSLSLQRFGLSLLGCEGAGVIIARAWRKIMTEV